jgi:hypothetical protein
MSLLGGATPIALLFFLSSCGAQIASADDGATSDQATYTAAGDDVSSGTKVEFDEDAAQADAEQEVADEGYSGSCTIDCGGHDAGFNWAADGHEDHGVSTSRSFDEGQEAYQDAVDQRLEEKREEFEDDPSSSDYAE